MEDLSISIKMAYNNILETIGNTPIVRINRLNPNKNVELYAKLESFNPLGSVKERIALSMIEGAEKEGVLTKDKIIIESSSGNTGIGLAMVAVVKGYKVTIVIPDKVTKERFKILKALGAELILTPGELGSDGAWDKADELAKQYPDKYVRLNQYTNKYNWLAHYETTGKEIWEQTNGKITHFVVGLGTTGTAMGVSKRLKEYNPDIKVVGVMPATPKHKQLALRNFTNSREPPILDWSRIDDKVYTTDEQAFNTAKELALKEGIFAGISSGSAMFAAIKLAETLDRGFVVALLPDTGERYLSTDLFGEQ